MQMHTVGRLVLSPHWLFIGIGALLLGLLIGCYAPVKEISLETRAQALDKSLICPICPGETIDQSQATLADQMQAIVREKIEDGWSDEQVRQYFVDRYGEGILAAPPKSGFNLLIWVVPPFGILGAMLALALSVRAMRRGQRHSHYHTVKAGNAGLEVFLDRVDEELLGTTAQQDATNPPIHRGPTAGES